MKRVVLYAIVLFAICLSKVALGAVWYVDVDNQGSQDGTQWSKAFTTIQAGIDAAFDDGGGEVWVAEGTYSESITLRSGVSMYGGFVGNETQISQRDISEHPTIIDASEAESGSPAYHVAVMESVTGCRIDGFTLTGGEGGYTEDWKTEYGGGIFCYHSDKTNTIANCKITGNSAPWDGGGLYLERSSPYIENCSVTNNHSEASGGGMVLGDLCAPTILNCAIINNTSKRDGGGLYSWDSSALKVLGCTIKGNSADSGGGLYFEDDKDNGHSPPVIEDCAIAGNKAMDGRGGGIYLDYSASVIIHCDISGNTASGNGGGVYCYNESDPKITGCMISGNLAGSEGGGFYCGDYSNYTISDSTISGNSAGQYGGGLCCRGPVPSWGASHPPRVTNCLISGNRAEETGGGLYLNRISPEITNSAISSNFAAQVGGGVFCHIDGKPILTNTILSQNIGHAIYENAANADATVSFCLFYDNPDGDYYDFDTESTLFGAEEVNALAEANDNLTGNPLFEMGAIGTWTQSPVYDGETNRTTLTDGTASFASGSLVGRLVNADTGQSMQALITANTATTMEVWGNITSYAGSGDAYRLIDYHLQGESACIDTGTGVRAPSTDLDGYFRPVDIEGKGSDGTGEEFDIGAYEYQRVDDLFIIPTTPGFLSSGLEGGPFAPNSASYRIQNLGSASRGWTAGKNVGWLDVSPAGGTLSPGETVLLDVTINETATALPVGVYTDTVTVTNTTNGKAQVRHVELRVVKNYFTELFDANDNDLKFQTLIFTADDSPHSYTVCRVPASTFPTDPAGGTEILLQDNRFQRVNLAEGAVFPFYGVNHTRFCVGSNGYVVLGLSGDNTASESFLYHFLSPRISALFDDLDPSAGGRISWKQLPDRVVVTYEKVPEKGTTNSNSFQIEMFFDGTITITHLEIDAKDGLVGLSEGNRVPEDFIESNLSDHTCSRGGIAFPGTLFGCSGELEPALFDADLRGTGTTTLDVTSSGGDWETVLLVEDSSSKGIFQGTITTSGNGVTPNDGVLQVAHGDTLRMIYQDSDDGTGAEATVTATATVDCVPPLISDVLVTATTSFAASIWFKTSEPTTAIVRYGTVNGEFHDSRPGGNLFQTEHTIELSGLTYDTQYFFIIEATDAVGNQAMDDNGGSAYSFTTLSLPNLTISHVEAPSSAALNQQITLSWTVQNIGEASLVPGVHYSYSFNDYVYLSGDDQVGDDTYVENFNFTSVELAVGESYTLTKTVRVPGVPSGTYWIVVITDYGEKIIELNEDDNAFVAGPIQIGQPNLAISNLTVPDQTHSGAEIEVKWTVTSNGGDTAACCWWDSVYLSEDTQLGGNDPRVLDLHSPGDLAVGSHYDRTGGVTLYDKKLCYIIVVTDSGNTLSEMNEADNMAVAGPITVGQTNLTISDLNIPSALSIGQEANVTWKVTNTGDLPAEGLWADRIDLSGDDQIGDDTTLASVKRPTILEPGAHYPGSGTITVPNVPPGQYWIVVHVDPGNGLPETDENDNASIAGPVAIGGTDLVTSDPVFPSEAFVMQQVDVHWKVTNTGGVAAETSWRDGLFLSGDNAVGNDTFLSSFVRPGALEPGLHYVGGGKITIPSVPPGDYWIIIRADMDENITEIHENNNILVAGPMKISAPNLKASDLVAPEEGWTRSEIIVSWKVTNTEGVPALGTWTDGVYLSSDDQPGNDTKLGEMDRPVELTPGHSYERAITVTIPEVEEGNYWIFLRTDQGGAVAETDEADNMLVAGPIPIRETPYANLKISEASCAISEVHLGQQFQVNLTVVNAGTGPTNASFWKDAVYFSVDQGLDATDVWIGDRGNVSFLNAGETYTSDIVATARGVSEGDYYIIVLTDATNTVYEDGFEGDNGKVVGQVQASLPPPADMRVTTVQAPEQAFSGQPISVSYHVENVGPGQVSVSEWVDDIYLSEDTQLDEAKDTRLGRIRRVASENRSPEPPNKIDYTASETVTLPVGISGPYYIFVLTDATDAINEWSFEGNNATFDETPVTIHLTPPPDLEVVAVNAPSSAVAGHPFNVSYTVGNFGATGTPNDRWTDAFFLSSDDHLDLNADIHLADRMVKFTGDPCGLAPEGTYSQEITLTPSVKTKGAFHLFVMVDRYDQVFELDNVNNISHFPINVESRPADLVVTRMEGDESAEAGQGLSVRWTVENQGTGDTILKSWEDRVFASQNDVIGDGDDKNFGSLPHNGHLDPGQGYDASMTVTVPFSFSGDYYLYVVTDRDDRVFEGADGENNNLSDLHAVHITRHIPDLRMKQAGVTTETGRLRFQWTVENVGENRTNVNYWYDAAVLSRNEVFGDADDLPIGSFRHAGALEPSNVYSGSELLNLPSEISDTVYFFVETNARREVDEGGLYENNVLSAGMLTAEQIQEMRTVPDLIVHAVSAPQDAISGQSFDLTWIVRNVGEFIARQEPFPPEVPSGKWVDRVYLSRDPFLDAKGDVYLGEAQIGASELVDITDQGNPYQTYSRTAGFTIPNGLTGPFYVLVAADRTNQVLEPNHEDNNIGHDPNAMLVTLALPKDLVVGTFSVPESPFLGWPIGFEYTLENHSDQEVSGEWTDQFYLSVDETLSPDDVPFGTYHHEKDDPGIPAQGSRTFNQDKEVWLPAVMPGQYYVILRTDAFNQIRESDETNNSGASLNKMVIGVGPIEEHYPDGRVTIRITHPDLLQPSEERSYFFRFHAEAGETVTVSATWLEAVGVSQEYRDTMVKAYLAYDRVPTLEDHDFSEEQLLHSLFDHGVSQPLAFAAATTGTYYLRIHVRDNQPLTGDPYTDQMKGVNEAFELALSPGMPLIRVDREIHDWILADGAYKRSYYMKFDAGEGETYAFDANWNWIFPVHRPNGFPYIDRRSVASIYVAHEHIPTSYAHDFAEDELLKTAGVGVDQRLTIPRTKAGTYYVCLVLQDAHPRSYSRHFAEECFNVVLSKLPFTVVSVDPAQAGNSGKVTFEVVASDLTLCSTLDLLRDGQVVREAQELFLAGEESSRGYVTFDLTGLEPGDYSIRVTNQNGASAAGSIRIVQGIGPQIGGGLQGPNPLRWGADYLFYVNYGNSGDGDGIAPLLMIENLGVNSYDLLRENLTSDRIEPGARIQLLGLGYGGSAGVLRPGEIGSIPLFFRTAVDSGQFRLQTITADDPRPLHFEEIEAQIRPNDLSDEAWGEIRERLMERIGDTWGDYVKALAEIAAHLARRGIRTYSVPELFQALYQEAAFAVEATVESRVSGGPECKTLSEAFVQALDAEGNVIDSSPIDGAQSYRLDLPSGTYTITAEAEGYARRIIRDVTVDESKVLVLNIHLAPEAVITGTVEMSGEAPTGEGLLVSAQVQGTEGLEHRFEGETDGTTFTISHLPAGTYRVTIMGEGTLPQSIEGIPLVQGEVRDMGTIPLQLPASVSGYVTIKVPGLSMKDLLVGAFQNDEPIAATTVAGDGTYLVSGLKPGDYAVRIAGVEGKGLSQPVNVTLAGGDKLTGVNFQVVSGAQISGLVKDPVSQEPLAGVPVILFGPNGSKVVAVTDNLGQVTFTELDPGDYVVSLPIGPWRSITLSEVDGGIYNVDDLGIPVGATLGGELRYHDGTPVVYGIVELFENGKLIGQALSDDQGTYAFLLLRGGTFELRASAQDATFEKVTGIHIGEGENLTQDLVAGEASIQVKISGAEIELEETLAVLRMGERSIGPFLTDAQGNVAFNNLAPGTYEVHVFGTAPYFGSASITLAEGEVGKLEVTLQPQAWVTGTVTEAGSGIPASGAVVFLSSQEDPERIYSAITDSTGRYEIRYAVPGAYTAAVIGTGFERKAQTGNIIADNTVLDLEATPVSSLFQGRLVDQSGWPVPVAFLTVEDQAGAVCGFGEGNPDGTFVIEALPTAGLRLRVSAPGYLDMGMEGLTGSSGPTNLGDVLLEPVSLSRASTVPETDLSKARRTPAALPRPSAPPAAIDLWDRLYGPNLPPTQAQDHVVMPTIYFPTCLNAPCWNIYYHLHDMVAKQNHAFQQLALTGNAMMNSRDGCFHDAVFGGLATAMIKVHDFQYILSTVESWEHTVQTLLPPVDWGRWLSTWAWIRQARTDLSVQHSAVSNLPDIQDAMILAVATTHSTCEGLRVKLRQERNISTLFLNLYSNSLLRENFYTFMIGQITLALNLIDQYENSMNFFIYNASFGVMAREIYDYWTHKYGQYRAAAKTLLDFLHVSCLDICIEGGPTSGSPASGQDGGGGLGGPGSNPPAPPGGPSIWEIIEIYFPFFVVSHDPNDIIGPEGFGEERWVASSATLPFRIRFENEADASGPAQRVVITQQLDEDLDFRTFRVGDFGWGDVYMHLPGDSPFYLGRIDLPGGSGLAVDVIITVDVVSGMATWIFQTVDPQTGEAPEDTLAGFLPPNTGEGIGEGFVTYTIRPKKTAETGSIIESQATIVFDTNEPIDTLPIANTIDAAAPSSRVTAATVEGESSDIHVTWTGADDQGSALASYTVYVSTGGGPLEAWMENTTLTEAWFTGKPGYTHTFYCAARDNAGNAESLSTEPDATAYVVSPDTDGDGLTDFEEEQMGTNPDNPDTDEDGCLDGEEFRGGRNPRLADPHGDLNGDCSVNLQDAIIGFQVVAKTEPFPTVRQEADVNRDGQIGLAEVLFILHRVSQEKP